MIIHGLQKCTLLDYPGHVAATIFTAACNYRCPFCHNAPLVTRLDHADRLDEGEVLAFVQRRVGILDGVCITGGEPTLQRDLPDFIRAIKARGLAVKLDTNGSDPVTLARLIEENLVDYVAMDIKNTPERYGETVGLPDFDPSPILESVKILQRSCIPHEFRTTVVSEFHTPEDIERIAAWLAGAPLYAIQPFTDSGDLIGYGDGLLPDLHAPEKAELEEMCARARRYIHQVVCRGA